jgi:4-carboxymuconolactone decarboxylase
MTPPRLPPVEPPYVPEVEEDLRALMPPGMPPLRLFRTVAHNPRVLRRLRRGGLLDPGAISLRTRELAILRTTARCGSEYEWGVHVAFFGPAAGFSTAQIAATVRGDADDPAWTDEADRLVIRLCDALHARARVDEPLWLALRAAFAPAALIELLALAGLYHMVAFVTNATELALEPNAPRFPQG